MSVIQKYVLVDADNNEGDYEHDDYLEACRLASIRCRNDEPTAVIERTYVYNDSELVWTPDGDLDIWPPEAFTQSYADRHRGFGSNVKPARQR